MAVYAYTRASSRHEAEAKESLEIQGRQLEGWAMMQGQSIAKFFVDPKVSGSIPLKDRPAGLKLLAILKRGDTIVAAKLDRMFRNALDALTTVKDFQERGISLVLCDLGHESVTNGIAKLLLTVFAAFAEAERERIGERIRAGKADRRGRGLHMGGSIPFGFRKADSGALEPIEAEQRIVRAVQASRASGEPYRAIQAAIDRDHGRKLSLRTLHRIASEGAR